LVFLLLLQKKSICTQKIIIKDDFRGYTFL
jgi:hypothetical protein